MRVRTLQDVGPNPPLGGGLVVPSQHSKVRAPGATNYRCRKKMGAATRCAMPPRVSPPVPLYWVRDWPVYVRLFEVHPPRTVRGSMVLLGCP